jgi:hypothetical protein
MNLRVCYVNEKSTPLVHNRRDTVIVGYTARVQAVQS